MRTLRLGTRGSALAQAQSRWVASRIRALSPGVEVDLVVIQTTGDKMSSVDSPAPGENIKATFVKEIEEALLAATVDFGVHSAKDLPGDLPGGLGIAAYPEREDPRDVFIGKGGASLELLPAGGLVGTSSLRRRIQLLQARPDLRVTPLRGNVDTRLRRLSEGRVDGLLVAAAGLKRLDIWPKGAQELSADLMVPAPGQGALALEARIDRPEVAEALAPLEHAATRREVELERSFLRAMGGGCSTPLGALARMEDGALSLSVFWSDPEGKNPRKLSGKAARPEELGSLVDGLRAQLSPA